ncbi:MAG: arginine--tRNA ligase [Clostridiales Family XIII bacterium]|jgi:arginyl-tRNA synthetase|nr:arginine--tRNA ligase [Clostridiales Family XIII bacterium]
MKGQVKLRDYRREIADRIAGLGDIAAAGLSADGVYDIVVPTTDDSKGDYAFPCFRLAKALRKAPPQIASELAAELSAGLDKDSGGVIDRVVSENAYVNFFVSREALARDVIGAVCAAPDAYGSSDEGAGRRVVVEFSSPNIAKPFHIGHIRSTVIGSSIEKIYRFLGYDTVRINHLGDYGTQFGKMIVAYRRWGKREDVESDPIVTLLSYYTKFHDEAEKDPSLEDEAREVFAKLERGGAEERELWQWFREESLKEFGRVYGMLGIAFDSYAGESFYSDKMDRVTDELADKGLLVESEGAQVVDLDGYGLGKALIKKSDGSTLYITRDIAAAIYRKEHYGFYKNLYIVASQQNLHFAQWKQVLKLMGYDWADDCVHIPFGLVSLAGGVMSTRAGRVVFLEDVLKNAVEKTREIVIEKDVNTDDVDETARQVGIGAVIFGELHNNRIKDYVFGWDKVLNFDGETGPYVQYVHARAASVIRKAGNPDAAVSSITPDAYASSITPDVDAVYLTSDSAFALAKEIYGFPDAVRSAGEKYEPSIVTRHIVDVAQAFNRFYHDEQVLVDDAAERAAKLALVFATKQTIKTGLALLGVEAPEKM